MVKLFFEKWKIDQIKDYWNYSKYFLKRSYVYRQVLVKKSTDEVSKRKQRTKMKEIVVNLQKMGYDINKMMHSRDCSYCGKTFRIQKGNKMVCGRCKMTYYCSGRCQKQHWNKLHRFACC